MSDVDDIDEFFKEIESVKDNKNDNNIDNNKTSSNGTTTTTTVPTTTTTTTNNLKRKLDDTTNTTTNTTPNKIANTTTNTTTGTGIKPMIPPSLMKKKQIAPKTPINNGNNKSVVSSKAVTYSATTINAMNQDKFKTIVTPTSGSSSGKDSSSSSILSSIIGIPTSTSSSSYGSTPISVLRPQVTMEEPKKHTSLTMEAAGEKWVDHSLAEWDPNDFRIFIGDLGNDVNDEMIKQAFSKYPTFLKAKVVYDKVGKSRGFGFVSFSSSTDFLNAMRDMNGKYIGNRPIKLRKSKWKDRLSQN